MRRVLTVAAVAAVLLVGSVSAAEWAVGADVSFYTDVTNFGGFATPLGSFNATPVNGATSYPGVFGFVRKPMAWNADGGFGAQWAGPVEVSTLTLNLSDALNRAIPKTIWVYTSTTADPVVIELPNDRTMTKLDLTQFNGGKSILADNSYLVLAIQDYWPGLTAGNLPVISYGFDAKAVGPADVNVNLGATMKGGNVLNNDVITYNPNMLNDGLIVAVPMNTTWDAYNNGEPLKEGVYWSRTNGLEQSATAVYENPVDIGSIGLGILTSGSAGRNCPKWVTLEALLEDGRVISQRVDLNKDLAQYGRYELDTPLFDVKELKLILPPDDVPAGVLSTETDNWKLNGGNANYGLTEFQAFAPAVPEPATMSLLALGGLVLLRRK